MTHKLDADDFFIQRIQQHCAERGLNFPYRTALG
jgi:hypothetical protein